MECEVLMKVRSHSEEVLNKLLVKLFNDILEIEEKTLREGQFSDVSVREMHIIETIGEDRERTMSEVASELGITVGTLTTAINKLIAKGYVIRKRIESDRRVVLIMLTERGVQANRIHDEFHDDMIKSVMDGLAETEEDVLVSALKRISTFFEDKYNLVR